MLSFIVRGLAFCSSDHPWNIRNGTPTALDLLVPPDADGLMPHGERSLLLDSGEIRHEVKAAAKLKAAGITRVSTGGRTIFVSHRDRTNVLVPITSMILTGRNRFVHRLMVISLVP